MLRPSVVLSSVSSSSPLRRLMHRLMHRLPVLALPLALLGALGCAPHSHDSGSPAADGDEIEPAVVTLFGERVLLFMEHPRLVAGESARFLAHFSVLATGEPVRAGRVELAVGDTALAVDAPARDGLFTPEGAFPRAGRFPARITVTSGQASESLDLGMVTVHPDAAAARAAAEAEGGEDPADAVPFLMEQQWKIDLLLAEAGPGRVVDRLIVPATIVAAEGATAEVAAPAGGRLLAPDGGDFPRSGDRVQAGQTLARVEPPLPAADAAQLRALDLAWSLESLAVERDLAAADAEQRFARRELERMAGLRPEGLATQQQLEQAERDLALADGRLAAAGAAREALVALRVRDDRESWSADGRLILDLPAPIAGELLAAGPVLGEAVEAGATVFRIVDRSRLWVEGRLSEFDASRLADAQGAVVTLPGLPGLRLEVAALGADGLFQRAPQVDPVTRTLRLRARLPEVPDVVHPGMLAELAIAVAVVDAPVVMPVEAVVVDQGRPTAYVMLGGETFQRRELVLGLRDGDRVEVLEGLAPGEHVATRGAATIRMAALSPSEAGHGHAH